MTDENEAGPEAAVAGDALRYAPIAAFERLRVHADQQAQTIRDLSAELSRTRDALLAVETGDEGVATAVPTGDEREEAHLAAVVAMHRRELLAYGQYAAIVHPEDLPVDYRPGMKLADAEQFERVPQQSGAASELAFVRETLEYYASGPDRDPDDGLRSRQALDALDAYTAAGTPSAQEGRVLREWTIYVCPLCGRIEPTLCRACVKPVTLPDGATTQRWYRTVPVRVREVPSTEVPDA